MSNYSDYWREYLLSALTPRPCEKLSDSWSVDFASMWGLIGCLHAQAFDQVRYTDSGPVISCSAKQEIYNKAKFYHLMGDDRQHAYDGLFHVGRELVATGRRALADLLAGRRRSVQAVGW